MPGFVPLTRVCDRENSANPDKARLEATELQYMFGSYRATILYIMFILFRDTSGHRAGLVPISEDLRVWGQVGTTLI